MPRHFRPVRVGILHLPDFEATATRLHSLNEVVAEDECDLEIFELQDVISNDREDPMPDSDLIDGSIGEGSPFHQTFAYCTRPFGKVESRELHEIQLWRMMVSC